MPLTLPRLPVASSIPRVNRYLEALHRRILPKVSPRYLLLTHHVTAAPKQPPNPSRCVPRLASTIVVLVWSRDIWRRRADDLKTWRRARDVS